MRQLVGILFLLATVSNACGGAAGDGRAASSPSGAVPGPMAVQVTRASDRGVVTARVGDRIQIALGTDYEWRLDPPDGVVLVPGVQDQLLVKGAQAIWTAAGAGTSTITATGTVICSSGQACILIAILFTTTVVVRGP